VLALLPVLPVLLPAWTAASTLFDAHVHYDANDAGRFTPAQVIATLEAAGVRRAAVIGQPPERALQLYEAAPGLIVPLLGVYRAPDDKQHWTEDSHLPARVAQALRDGPWHGIGELHLFAPRRHSPVFLRIAALAEQHGLPLLLHCDPAVIDSLYARSPDVRVVWAHAGAYPYPPLLRDYLERYPGLYVDLSMRDDLVAPDGTLAPDWETLFWEYPERFLAGVDTFSAARWKSYGSAVRRIRHWLGQLPAPVAERIAYRNAAGVFDAAR
jgi:predicted TIM-barrel fold metal-dependent hydrolase